MSTLEKPPDGVWRGLEEWRADKSSGNRAWVWGKKDAVPADADPKLFGPENAGMVPPGLWASPFDTAFGEHATPLPETLAECAELILRTPDPAMKAALSHRAYAAFIGDAKDDSRTEKLALGLASPPDSPARPSRPELVPPHDVPSPKTCALGFSAAMMHNIAHIELNAIDLAWDTVARFSPLHVSRFRRAANGAGADADGGSFSGLPDQFFVDFAKVADDESRHLGWCLQRLREMGVSYGDISAHNVLWEGALSTIDSLDARLAVVPCMQEARGLDAGPRLVSKLRGRNDNRSADIIARISTEELAHVAVGVAWFREMCSVVSADPKTVFLRNIERHAPESLRGPFNHKRRIDAGLEPEWYSVKGDDGAYRMGIDFSDGVDGVAFREEGSEQRDRGDPGSEAVLQRLKQVLVVEGVTEKDLS